jgi:hypothetical protein
MIAACLGMAPVAPAPTSRRLLDFKPVFRNRPAMGFRDRRYKSSPIDFWYRRTAQILR